MARPREFDEAQVIQQAMHVFWQNGYQGTSVQDLVAATGLKPGSLYGTFGDKHGVFIAALDAYMAAFIGELRATLAASEDPVETLRQFIRGGGEAGPEATAKGCMVGNTCNELAATDEVAQARLREFILELRSVMADGLRRGQELGSFGKDRDPEAVAAFIQSSMQGMTLLAKSAPGDDVIAGVVGEILRVLD